MKGKRLIVNLIILFLFILSVGPFLYGRLLPSDSIIKEFLFKMKKYSLKDFYSRDPELELAVSKYMDMLTDREKVAQMLILPLGENGYSINDIRGIVKDLKVGGLIFLKNRYEDVPFFISEINKLYSNLEVISPIYSIDGEPSLLHTRLIGLPTLPAAGSIVSEEECMEVSSKIAEILNKTGIQYNFAPVCDFSFNTQIIGNRSFGGDADHIVDFCKIFIDTMTSNNIASTVKHFPGHGTIEGDTHGRLLFASGLPPEIEIFKRLIDYGIVSVMVGHIAVNSDYIYNTRGRPSTISRNMVTGVLRKRLGFDGIIITDAMTMNAVSGFKDPDVEAAKAGCDIILMPRDPYGFVARITTMIQNDREFRIQVMNSVRRIIRLKICLGIVKNIR